MELDNLKSLWKKDSEMDVPEISLEKQNLINSPLHMMKLNMRTEFWLVIIFLACSIRISFDEGNNGTYNFYNSIATIFALSVIVYFYMRLRKFYNKFSNVSPNTNYSLLNLKTELMVTKEIFLSYYVLYIPLSVFLFIIDTGMKQQTEIDILLIIISIIISVGLILLARKYWMYYMYGKYINQIVDLVDELNGVESKEAPRKETFYEKSQMYFVKKWGLLGNMLNVIIWFVIFITLAATVLFVIAFIVLKLASSAGWIDLVKLQAELLKRNSN